MTDIFLSDGGSKYPALKFENVNDTHSGTVIEVKKLEAVSYTHLTLPTILRV